MDNISKQELITKHSHNKGYYVDKDGNIFNKDGKQIKTSKSSQGYLSFNIRLHPNGNATRCNLHKLQAYQKFGNKMFEKGIVVRHLNGIKTDNSYGNIEIGTHSENMFDIPKEERILHASKANLKYDHKAIIQDKKDGMSINEIMKKYNISSKGTVSFIINKSLKSGNE